jgi:hypothetical protein
MKMLTKPIDKVKGMFRKGTRHVSPAQEAPHHRFRPSLEQLESRGMASIVAVQSVAILAQRPVLRLAPGTSLHLVVQVTGTDNATGRLVTLEGTADQLAAQGIDVNFLQRTLNSTRRIIANLPSFRDSGVLLLRHASDGIRARILALAGGVRSQAIQIVLNSKHDDISCDGTYQGLYRGTGQAQGFPSQAVNGAVAFNLVGRKVIVVTSPAPGSGQLTRPCSAGNFSFGGGSVAGANFTITLELLSDGSAFANGAWFLTRGPATGAGDWFATRVGR